jgi:diguanylate cyclase (GGDEF)-like protein
MKNGKQPIRFFGRRSNGMPIQIKRSSLVNIFSIAFLGILTLFVLVNILAIFRLIDFQAILSKLTDEALPKITHSGETFRQVNQLTYLTARLASSPSQAFRRIAYKDIEKKIKQIAEHNVNQQDDKYLQSQLQAITKEFSGLNQLVENRIKLYLQVSSREKQMYTIYNEVMNYSLVSETKESNQSNALWFLNFSQIVALSSKALTETRLTAVRQSSAEIVERLALLLKQSEKVKFADTKGVRNIAKRLENILVSDSGLLPTKIRELRNLGRAIGRKNFVHNLVGDYARQVEYYSNQITEIVNDETASSALRVREQTKLILVMVIFSVIFLVGIIYYLRRKIVVRLARLNKCVLDRLDGGDLELRIKGNDEISDIAQSFNFLVEEIEMQKRKLEELSLTDGLTGVANRRYLDKQLSSDLKISQRQRLTMSLLIMDVDCFKDFNDHYGHLAGDDCLKMITGCFSRCMLRKSDFVARFGGEEFVCLLPDTNEKGAERIAKNILDSVASLKIPHEKSPIAPYVTISIGIACYYPEEGIGDATLLKRADQALFVAKNDGKNCFRSFVPVIS